VRAGVRDIAHRGADIHDPVALHDAEFEVVEIRKLHVRLQLSQGKSKERR
jgi:hypothetical protein